MRTLNLSGFKPSDSLNISVSQGALTAGPVNVPAWGGATSSGNITIQTHRSHMQVAPDSVRFWVDLSASDFDTPAPAGGEIYDARLHDLIYLWDMDDTVTTWSEPVNVLAAWKNRNAAKGPFVMHMYPDPGTYSPSVLVIEPSSGKTATASLSGGSAITVLDPDDVYPGTATICVNPIGDNDFSAKPAGAATINLDEWDYSDSEWTSRLGGVAKRWLFKRDSNFDWRMWVSLTTTRGMYIGSYGTGEKPSVRGSLPGSSFPLQVSHDYGAGVGPYAPDLRIVGIKGVGDYDPVTTRSDYNVSSSTSNWLYAITSANIMISDCDFDGLQGSQLYMAMSGVAANEETIHLDDCTLSNFGGQYPVFGGFTTHERSGMAVTGCRFAQTPGAVGSDPQRAGSSRAIIRSNSPHRFHMRGCDLYHTDHWQFCVKVPETPREYGVLVNVHSCSFEGGTGSLVFNGNYTQASLGRHSHVHNIVVDGVAVCGSHSSYMPFQVQCSGVTIRNSIIIIPSTWYLEELPKAFVRIMSRGTFDADIVGKAPIRVHNMTFRNDKTTAQTTSKYGTLINVLDYLYTAEPDEWTASPDPFTAISFQNNVMHQPNLNTPQDAFAPLSGDALWTVRDLGYRNTDPGFAYWASSSIAIPNGDTLTIAYAKPYGVASLPTATQATFAGSTGREQVYVGDTDYHAADGDFTVDYGATEITITNTSGVTWAPSGQRFWVQLDMGTTAPYSTDSTPPTGAMKDTKPLTGSAALGAALSGNVSYMDILGTTRTAPADKGAWEVA